MSKAVMLSIRPKWCEKIANGEKTIEALWAKLKSRDDLVNQLETENYRLRRKAGEE